MNYMKEKLDQLRIRPGMYIQDVTLQNLHAFMNGYMYRIFQDEDIVPEFYPGFQEYIEDVYHITTGQHWSKIITFYSDSDEEALTKFFEHLDTYTEIEENSSVEKSNK
ncbi:hypothetical protein V3C10_14455 [[Clostridium] symbiosum]|uniref:hypothetical protein n=1 Tax=Clostridium symbiosum TaxID=1512 RepID=UPI001D06B1D4|nr:hypothetical protein [[Clostridium] symbiosum]MCB6611097.1 hypothetical protein [[Clostridium] symbiosum]MCB6933257.1 hypothetical protein [[Clostridium] symbiosum]